MLIELFQEVLMGTVMALGTFKFATTMSKKKNKN